MYPSFDHITGSLSISLECSRGSAACALKPSPPPDGHGVPAGACGGLGLGHRNLGAANEGGSDVCVGWGRSAQTWRHWGDPRCREGAQGAFGAQPIDGRGHAPCQRRSFG